MKYLAYLMALISASGLLIPPHGWWDVIYIVGAVCWWDTGRNL